MKRGEVTDAVLAAVATCGFPVGDAEAPPAGGWQGEMNQSDFIPYTVVTPMSSQAANGPITDPNADFDLPYALTSYGVSRRQCELMADSARAAVLSLSQTMVNDRSIEFVSIESVGQVTRIDSVEPAYYAQSDTVTLTTTL